MKNLFIYALLISFALLIVGCVTTQKTLSAEQYLHLAANAQGVTQQDYLLKAANSAVLNRNSQQAQQILSQVNDPTLTPPLAVKKQLLTANVEILDKQYDAAYTSLQNISNQNQLLSSTDQIAWHQLMAYDLQQKGNVMGAINEHIVLNGIIHNQNAQQDNLRATWQMVSSVDSQTLNTLLPQAQSNEARGWLSLALAAKAADSAQQLANWKTQYPNHPANILFVAQNSAREVGYGSGPNHIALLLPLQGALSAEANAIRNGFFAAYYNAKSQNSNAPIITVVDTSQQSMQSAYQQALTQGANFIVGPLSKDQLIELTQSTRLTVPTLALNTLPNAYSVSISNLYQFALSPVDEAQQVAVRAHDDHHQNALIIAPANNWGQNIAQAFRAQWLAQGGKIVGEMQFNKQQDFADQIRQLLGINMTDKSMHILKRKLGNDFVAPQIRQDADVIFMVAQGSDARLIRPLLNYYYADNIPVYATSLIYEGTPNYNRDQDLNGVIFCDMPWVLQAQHMQPIDLNSIQQQVRTLWPNSYRQFAKLYGLGVDAYNFAAHFNQYKNVQGLMGATGSLYVYNQHYLYRKLLWSKMVDGVPQTF